jgi:hypothetical protein
MTERVERDVIARARRRPGVIVAVHVRGVWHEGIATDATDLDGLPVVIHKSKRTGHVTEEPWRLFAPRGRTVRIVGYPGRLSGADVLTRARATIGEPWSIVDNCQRWCRRCHAVPARSPTLEAVGGGGAGIVLAITTMIRLGSL